MFFECRPLQLNCRASVQAIKTVIILETESDMPAAQKVVSSHVAILKTHVHKSSIRGSGPYSKTNNKAVKLTQTTGYPVPSKR